MTINANLLGIHQVVRPKSERKKGEKKDKPIADRNWKNIPFVRESVPETVDDEMVAYLRAWKRSPAMTIIAMATAGFSTSEIAKKFGIPEKHDSFQAAVKDAQQLLRQQIANDVLDQIPDAVEYRVQDSDGNIQNLNVAEKLRKAVAAALFNGKNDDVKFSVVKNVPFHIATNSDGIPVIPTLRDIFSLTSEQLDATKRLARSRYGNVFRTRDTSAGTKMFALPPALAALDIELNEESA